jgi:nicotinamide mononucleotide adenylyltransferase
VSLSQLSGIENADSPICYRTDIDSALESLQHWKTNIRVIQQLIPNDISSTKIRLFLRRAMSIQYLIPAPVIEYIEQHGLYQEDGASSVDGKE